MVLFFPIQQELDCISSSGRILGKIKFDGSLSEFKFCPDDESVELTGVEEASIVERLTGLASGKYSLAMEDDD
ncbi:hypothetical protein [Aliamphritea hakodatensis]|uniref:hypothetical protein n=1 Tax=Aliamphritea hakodatensis TaxID=2895352 RepID=UPI0022FD5273|nr:hypothetical protein [Aliamphritea hakodatensis]